MQELPSNPLDRCVRKMSTFSLGISMYVIYPILTITITVDVILRYFFNAPLAWGQELSCMLLVWALFGPACRCEETHSNVALDLVYNIISPQKKRIVRLVSSILGLSWVGIMAYRTLAEVPIMYELHESGVELPLELWPVRLGMGLFLSLLCLRLCLNIYHEITMKHTEEKV
jgi:TRAP-type C4-dicarboxylate transport system permease small subunit